MITVEGIRKTFRPRTGHKVAVDGVSFEVPEGRFFTLLGPSGCGKTTILRCIAGLEIPDEGTIVLGGDTVYRHRVIKPTYERNIGMVFQSYAVWPHMLVFDNVAFPMQVQNPRPSRAEIRRRVGEILETVGLEGLEQRPAVQLSGGQQQRLSLARALVSSPRILLLDEPLSNLDAKLRERMRTELRSIQQRIGITTLFVTHDQVEALSMSDEVAVMNDGQIIQKAPPEDLYRYPISPFVANFVGGMNLIPAKVTQVDGPVDGGETRSVVVETSFGRLYGYEGTPGLKIGDEVIVSIRFEEVLVGDHEPSDGSEQSNRFVTKRGVRLFNGDTIDQHLGIGGQEFRARLPAGGPAAQGLSDAGEQLTMVLPRQSVRVLKETKGAETKGGAAHVEKPAPPDDAPDAPTAASAGESHVQ